MRCIYIYTHTYGLCRVRRAGAGGNKPGDQLIFVNASVFSLPVCHGHCLRGFNFAVLSLSLFGMENQHSLLTAVPINVALNIHTCTLSSNKI